MPDGWLERAAAAQDAVAAGGDPNENAAVWRELKDSLAALLPEKKCWYCESPVERSDNAVDHFRPKNRVSDAEREHLGYRWLAFDFRNFRYACTFCNSRRKDVEHGTSGGKADRFPLVAEADRVYEEGPVDGEYPMLLDPCDLDEWRLLGCKRENGDACATSESAVERRRAEASIEVYHLSYQPTCKQRHSVALRLLEDVDEAKRLFVEASSVPAQEPAFKRLAKSIKRAIDRSAAFSGEMIFLLRGQRSSEHPWIQDLLEA
jgi:hypothetical protein